MCSTKKKCVAQKLFTLQEEIRLAYVICGVTLLENDFKLYIIK